MLQRKKVHTTIPNLQVAAESFRQELEVIKVQLFLNKLIKFTQTVINIKVLRKMDKNMAKEDTHLRMDHIIKVNGKIIKCKEEEISFSQMAKSNMKGNGIMINLKVGEF